ncbi:MAG TPA: GNAT family N-acetyltransferase [Thermoleophilaceae bacterium]|jgi:GNAT superfamily N-acetyltransferase
MTADHESSVQLLELRPERDGGRVEELTTLINDVYEGAESGLWRNGATRTTAAEVTALIQAGELTVATRSGRIVGSVRVHDVGADASEFGLLVAAEDQRGAGIGRALLDFVEARGRNRGLRAMQLELLVPRGWSHPSKEFLRDWYRRRGYRITRTERFERAYPRLAPLLATPCDLEIHEKPLQPGRSPA